MNLPPIIPADIRTAALRFLNERLDGVTPQTLAGLLAVTFGRSRRWAKSAMAAMVAEGELAYRERHGHTVIEPSFDRPVRFSPHVIVMPPDAVCEVAAGEVAVRLAHGASFGTGRHPTTRLSVQGIDVVLSEREAAGVTDAAVLDVGTGSGILAITALLLGGGRGVGVDIDPCAVDEGRRNAALNGLSSRLTVGDIPLDEIEDRFMLITANLRFPTLRQILEELVRLSAVGAAWVISGIRPEEIRPLEEDCSRAGRTCIWRAVEKDWAALAFASTP